MVYKGDRWCVNVIESCMKVMGWCKGDGIVFEGDGMLCEGDGMLREGDGMVCEGV